MCFKEVLELGRCTFYLYNSWGNFICIIQDVGKLKKNLSQHMPHTCETCSSQTTKCVLSNYLARCLGIFFLKKSNLFRPSQDKKYSRSFRTCEGYSLDTFPQSLSRRNLMNIFKCWPWSWPRETESCTYNLWTYLWSIFKTRLCMSELLTRHET